MKVLSDSFSEDMVEIYDRFFLGEDKCQTEVDYIMQIFGQRIPDKHVLLDVGCGTGAYSEFFSPSFDIVISVDRSADMISFAREEHNKDNIEYLCKDAGCEEQYGSQKGDAAIALAHVIGYQLTNVAVMSFLKTINRNLYDNGVFLFSFYHQPALFLNKLEPRHIKKKVDSTEIIRISNAKLLPDENCLALDYYYVLSHDDRTRAFEIHEKMRYFSKYEVELFLTQTGFEVLSFFEYGGKNELTTDHWNGGCLARKVESYI